MSRYTKEDQEVVLDLKGGNTLSLTKEEAEDAYRAATTEHKLSAWEAIKLFRVAIFWMAATSFVSIL